MADLVTDLVTRACGLAERAVAAARELTRNGEALDEHQVVVERVAYVATQARVIADLHALPASLAPYAEIAIAELALDIPHRLAPIGPSLGLAQAIDIGDALSPAKVEALGARVIADR